MKWQLLFLLVMSCAGMGWAQITIHGPLEGRAGEDLTVRCTAGPVIAPGLILVYENGSDFTGTVSYSNNGNTRIILIHDVGTELNGTRLGCSFSSVTSDLLPVLLFSHPMFAMGGASRSVNITVNENQATEIPTEVRGYPYPMINISRSGGQEVGPAVSASPSTVSISKSVSRADSGTYTLTLFNSEGVATMVLDLAVSYPPTFSDTVSPDLLCVTSSATATCSVMVGSSATLNCEYDAYSTTSLNIITPENSQATPDLSENTISIADAQLRDNGTYVCVVNDTLYPSVMRTIHLQVGTVPGAVSVVNVVISESSVTILWTYVDSPNSLPLTNFSLTFQQATGQDVILSRSASSSSRSVLFLKSEFMEGDYQVSVLPFNILGQGNARDGLFRITATNPTRSTSGSPSKTAPLSLLLSLSGLILCVQYTSM